MYGSFPQAKQFLDLPDGKPECLITQFWHFLSGDSVRSHGWRAQSHKAAIPSPQVQMPIANAGCYLRFWPISSQLEVSTTPSWYSINQLSRLTELRKTIYLLDKQFIIKECNLGVAIWKRFKGQHMGKGSGASQPFLGLWLSQPILVTLPAHLCVHLPGYHLNPIVQGVLWKLHYIGVIYGINSIQVNLQPVSPPWRLGGGPLKFQP